MTWILLAAVAVVAFVSGMVVRGRRSPSPVEQYEERQRRAALAADLAAKAGTMDEVRALLAAGNKLAAIRAFREQTRCGLRERKRWRHWSRS